MKKEKNAMYKWEKRRKILKRYTSELIRWVILLPLIHCKFKV